MKKRACRMAEEEKAMHERAVKIRKMTDSQLCEFIDSTYGQGMEEGAKLAQVDRKEEQADGVAQVKVFIDYLVKKTGTGNRIGHATILQLTRELEKARDTG
jgi:hypothetical protein